MEENGNEEGKQQAQLEEAYRKMLMDLDSDTEDKDEDEGSNKPPAVEEKEEEKKDLSKQGQPDDKDKLLRDKSPQNGLGIAPVKSSTPPPPPPPIMVEDFDEPEVSIVVEPTQKNEKVVFNEGRTSPNGRMSPLRNNRVEPMIIDDDNVDSNQNKDTQPIFMKENKQAFEMFDKRRTNEKLSTPDSGVESLGSDKRSSVKTISDQPQRKMSKSNKVFMRTFKQRASQENFALYGLLTPALCLVPKIDGNDALTETFSELRGEDRELKLAAAHIDDAISGRGKYGKARAFFKSKQGRWCFKMINSQIFKFMVLLMATVHLILTFFEPPPNSSVSPAILVLTPLCIIVYAVDVGVHLGFLSWQVFLTLDENRWIRREAVLTVMYTVDYIMLVIEYSIGQRLAQPFRCLRAAIILCKLNNVQHVWDVVMSIIIKLGKVFFIIVLFIILFSAIGVHLFEDIYNNMDSSQADCGNETDIYEGAFDHVGITFLRLFVLLSTENYPDLMIPAFSTNPWYFLYFGIFLFAGVFFLTAILLAIIVDSYWSFAKKHVKKERARERAELAKAWNLLDPLGSGSLPVNDPKVVKLLKILKPHHTDEMNQQLIDYLDDNDDGQIDSLEWTIRLNEALSFEFEEDKFYDMDTNGPKCLYTMQYGAQKIVRSIAYSRIVLILIIFHCILFCLRWRGMSTAAKDTIQILKTTILAIFVADVFLRVTAEGKRLLQVVDLLDISMIVIALAFNIPIYFIPPSLHGMCNIFSGVAVILRLGFNSAQTKKVVMLFSTKVFPVMSDLIILVFIIMYFAAVLGWELFVGIQPDTSYDAGVYEYGCGIGFDSFSCSMLMVFQIVTTSNWHEIMNSAMVASTDWACIYFLASFVAINLVVMNLFVAIAIEAFNKLGTDKEAEKEQNPQKEVNQEESFANSAVNFINSFFESSRVEQKENISQRPIGSPRMRRPSRVSVTTTYGAFPGSPANFLEVPPSMAMIPVIEEEEEEEPEEDLSGLSREARKKHQMKKKREKRKNKMKTMILVMTAFRATKDSELHLNVGEEIEVVGKQDEWWEGRKDNEEQGWFPASHVKEIKRSQPPPTPTPYNQRPHVARKTTQDSINFGRSDSEDSMSQTMNSSQDRLMLTSGSLGGTETNPRRPKLKLKNTSGNWRKEILGDITVMNPQELKELNKILKSQHRSAQSGMNSSLGGTLRKQATISESIEEESEPEPKPEPVKAMPTPVINVQHVPSVPSIIEEESEPEEDNEKVDSGAEGDTENTLTVDKPELPKELKKKKNKEQTKNGEMPSWATNFLMSNNLKASSDIKFGDKPAEGGDGAGSRDNEGSKPATDKSETPTGEDLV